MSPEDALSLSRWELVADVATWAVIIGVAGEGIELILKLLKHFNKLPEFCIKYDFWIDTVAGIFFWMMVVGGLVFELRGSHKVKVISDRENARINKLAGDANEQAGIANREAAQFRRKAAELELEI